MKRGSNSQVYLRGHAADIQRLHGTPDQAHGPDRHKPPEQKAEEASDDGEERCFRHECIRNQTARAAQRTNNTDLTSAPYD